PRSGPFQGEIAAVDLVDGERRELQMALPQLQAYEVRGQVRVNGRPFANAIVQWGASAGTLRAGGNVKADGDGNFTARVVACPPRFAVTGNLPATGEGIYVSVDGTVEPAPAAPLVHDLDIALARVRLRFVDGQGRAVPGVWAFAKRSGRSETRAFTTADRT